MPDIDIVFEPVWANCISLTAYSAVETSDSMNRLRSNDYSPHQHVEVTTSLIKVNRLYFL